MFDLMSRSTKVPVCTRSSAVGEDLEICVTWQVLDRQVWEAGWSWKEGRKNQGAFRSIHVNSLFISIHFGISFLSLYYLISMFD